MSSQRKTSLDMSVWNPHSDPSWESIFISSIILCVKHIFLFVSSPSTMNVDRKIETEESNRSLKNYKCTINLKEQFFNAACLNLNTEWGKENKYAVHTSYCWSRHLPTNAQQTFSHWCHLQQVQFRKWRTDYEVSKSKTAKYFARTILTGQRSKSLSNESLDFFLDFQQHNPRLRDNIWIA